MLIFGGFISLNKEGYYNNKIYAYNFKNDEWTDLTVNV